jgi:hypothetical protein
MAVSFFEFQEFALGKDKFGTKFAICPLGICSFNLFWFLCFFFSIVSFCHNLIDYLNVFPPTYYRATTA